MKSSRIFRVSFCFSTAALLAVAAFALSDARANEWSDVPSQPSQGTAPPDTSAQPSQSQAQPQQQQMFASPDDAVKALRFAVEANDRSALAQIFGPQFSSLQTGDPIQDAKNQRHFATAMADNCQLEKQNDNEYFVDVGTNNWPMPIPITQANGQWYFDTAAGKEEVIDRHIGRDELAAIGVCRAYVDAQRQFGNMNNGTYAQKFENTPGQKDGLSWEPSASEQPDALGHLLAEAQEVGEHKGAQPFHGYYFKILTMQGSAASGGKMDYLRHGQLRNGFALVAYPEHWNQSGVMTFIVNQDGKVYQCDFGDKTYHVASKIKEYNPDKDWTLVTDQGIPVASR